MTHFTGTAGGPDGFALAQLTLTVEELTVAEDELRVQNIELERTRDVLEAERERYRELFLQAPVPYFVTDGAGTIRVANRAASQLLDCRLEYLVGKPLTVFARIQSRKRLRALMLAATASDGAAKGKFTVVSRSGVVVRVAATSSAMRDPNGNVVELGWLMVDRTQRARRARARRRRAMALERLVERRTSELAQVNQVKDRLMATTSHELRTVLAAIGGYAEILEMGLRGPLTEPQLTDVHRIQRAYNHLNKVVDDLMTYSRVAGERPILDLSDFNAGDVVRSVIDMVSPEAQRKSIALRLPGADAAPAHDRVVVHADGDRLRQILVNIVGNAIKFAPNGGWVAIEWKVDEGMGVVEVLDSGPGIPLGSEELIFQPFVRLHRTANVPGTGLGLAISREFARAMGGDISVCPGKPGCGCFVLRVPLSTSLATQASRARSEA